jgi:hypothetical protein
MKQIKYNSDFLNKYCQENNIKIIDTNEKINRETIIKGYCIEKNCDNKFEKTFRRMIENAGPRCYNCSRIVKNIKDKITFLQKYGVEHNFQSEIIKEQIKKTNLEKYGVEHHSQNNIIKDKKKKINLEKYGVENIFQSEIIKEQIKKTNLEKYGVEYSSQNNIIKNKKKKTNLEKYGVENVSQNNIIKDKKKKTNLEKYGVEYALQNSEIYEKACKSCFKAKIYILPSNKQIKLQGYEHFAMNDLLLNDKIEENDIITNKINVPECWWIDNFGKKHRYYIDIFIKTQNKGIEIKSIYTFEVQNEYVLKKQEAFKNLGYLCEIWIYNNKGQKINYLI